MYVCVAENAELLILINFFLYVLTIFGAELSQRPSPYLSPSSLFTGSIVVENCSERKKYARAEFATPIKHRFCT